MPSFIPASGSSVRIVTRDVNQVVTAAQPLVVSIETAEWLREAFVRGGTLAESSPVLVTTPAAETVVMSDLIVV